MSRPSKINVIESMVSICLLPFCLLMVILLWLVIRCIQSNRQRHLFLCKEDTVIQPVTLLLPHVDLSAGTRCNSLNGTGGCEHRISLIHALTYSSLANRSKDVWMELWTNCVSWQRVFISDRLLTSKKIYSTALCLLPLPQQVWTGRYLRSRRPSTSLSYFPLSFPAKMPIIVRERSLMGTLW